MAARRLKELKRVERSLYKARAGRGSRSAVGEMDFEIGDLYFEFRQHYPHFKARTAGIERGCRALLVIEVNGGFSERVQSREKISVLL